MLYKRKLRNTILTHLFVIFVGFVMVYPLLWMVSSSFKPSSEIFAASSFFPQEWTFENYIQGWKGFSGYTFSTFYLNSFLVTGLVVVGVVLSSTLTAFAFSKINFRFKGIFFSIMILTLMLPKHVKIIPQYIVFTKLGWINTYLPLIVPSFFGTQGFFIFQMVQYMKSIPFTLFEAARMDGCSIFGIYRKIVMPLSLPCIITTIILGFMWTWNDFFSQLLYLSDVKKFTISIALRMFVDTSGGSSWGAMFAMSVVSLLPLFALFLIFQRYIVEGVTSGSIKG